MLNTILKQKKTRLIITLIIVGIIFIIGTYFTVQYCRYGEIVGSWTLDNTRYEFSIFGRLHYYFDYKNKACDLWNCNFDSAGYKLTKVKGVKYFSFVDEYGGTYGSTEYKISHQSSKDKLIITRIDDSDLPDKISLYTFTKN